MSADESTVFIAPGGELTFVYDDRLMAALGALGPVETVRGSRVEPAPDGKSWLADMSPLCDEPIVLGPFASRAEALAAERAWIIDYLRHRGLAGNNK